MERILAVFAHPDDEASCVGTLANHSDAGDAVRLLWLSRGENATTLAMAREEKIQERARQAMYGTWPVEELLFANLTRHGMMASCRLAGFERG